MTKLLHVIASGRPANSVSRRLGEAVIDALRIYTGGADVTQRDLNSGIDFVDAEWIEATFADADARSSAQRAALSASDTLVAELRAADWLVISTPMYNFGVPARLKAWVDMIARAQLTFRYTANGPVGLLQGRKAIVVLATGGVPVDSPVDFATPYLRQALGFVGIDTVAVVAADQLNNDADGAVAAAKQQIADLGQTLDVELQVA